MAERAAARAASWQPGQAIPVAEEMLALVMARVLKTLI